MRRMYDGITPARLPNDGAIYASYVDGHWPNFGRLAGLFPGRLCVSIAVNPAHDAQVLDVELYDATPDQVPAWAARQRRRGQVPTIYCNTATWPSVVRSCHRAGAALPLWWAANYDLDGSALPAGAIALQYRSTPGYDLSIVAPYWPGVDRPPARKPPAPRPPARPARVTHVVRAGENLSNIAAAWHVSLSALERANPRAGHPAGHFDNVWPGDVLVKP